MKLFGEFFRFGLVGTLGFVVDAGILMGLLWLGVGPYLARVPSFMAAATTTWVCNRHFTFHSERREGLRREWVQYMGLMVIGGAVNYGTYALLVWGVALVNQYPVLGVAGGSIAGMLVNFASSRRLLRPRAASRA